MLRYAGPYLFLAAVPALSYGLSPAASLLGFALLLAALAAAETLAPRGAGPEPKPAPAAYRAVVLGYIPLQILAVAWGLLLSPRLAGWDFAGLAVSIGLTNGVFGVLAAHEAVHSRDPRERLLGTLLLTTMSYRHFRIAHLHGHHRYAGTPRDAATARLGEGFYRFLGRTLAGQFLEAWRFARRRTGWLRNRVMGDLLVMAALYAGIGLWLGGRALGFFLLQGAVAVAVLELFNYIAHYGLMRRPRRGDGRLEPFAEGHSWNSSNVLANALVFNMGRHSSHHQRPGAPYQHLRCVEGGPELPLGYAGSLLLALVPPLWRRAMDPVVAANLAQAKKPTEPGLDSRRVVAA